MRRKSLSKYRILIIIILCLLLAVLVLSATFLLPKTNKENLEGTIPTEENGMIDICFTREEDCALKIIAVLKDAESIKAALYDLDEPSITNILSEKNADVLIDEDNYAEYGKRISRIGLMHNKFFLAYPNNNSGDTYLITGSTNPTKNDIYKNDNNMLIIKSDYIFKNYESEFLELKNNQPNAKTQYQKIILNGFLIENYFCPEDNCEEHVVAALNKANKSIYFMAFSFTSDKIGKTIMSKQLRLEIRGVFDANQVASNKDFSEYPLMKKIGLDVKMKKSPGKLHHKVFIIDNETVITGSYNPTASGNNRNDENILIIHNKEVANAYLHEFERIWGSTPSQ